MNNRLYLILGSVLFVIPIFFVDGQRRLYAALQRAFAWLRNDMVVSDRQKDKGMSGSRCSSVALAAVTALVRNEEYMRCFQTGSLAFSLAA